MNNTNFSIEKGELVVILGPSGAGKTTCLNILGGMDTATSGEVIVDNKLISDYTDKDLIFTKFMSEVTYLQEKIYNITTFDSYKIEKEDISNLSNILLDLKISYEELEYFNNKTLTKSIDEINSSIDEMIGKISDLQKEIGKMNSLVISKMSSCKREINSFLKLAGFNYEFDIIKDGDEKNSITILKYVNSEYE